jgi:lipoic acid synthetase
MEAFVDRLGLHTVCESARCPNQDFCFKSGTATFMILGDVCTRRCTFCAVGKGMPLPLDPLEPAHLARAVKKLALGHVVITSVTRDDLQDEGASQFARAVEAIRDLDANIKTEVLVPDFGGNEGALKIVVESSPAVLAHNLETVPRLYGEVRPGARYQRSLTLLRRAKMLASGLLTKSGIMLGLGETQAEVVDLMRDLRDTGCDVMTIGQYLQPSLKHHPLVRYAPPQEYATYRHIGLEMGFKSIVAGPLVRSSFRAAAVHEELVGSPARLLAGTISRCGTT